MRRKPRPLTTAEFAARLGITHRRARALAASGRVKDAVKIGRDWLFAPDFRVTPGDRGPALGAAKGATQVVVARPGRAQALKRTRQRRFQRAATGSPELAGSAVVFRLSSDAVRFDEPDLTFDDLP